jgi:hypothetical protein
MKLKAMMRWVGPAAIAGAAFMVLSDQVGLVVHLPEMGNDSLGYHAVGSGLFLLVFTLLLVGMFGLYARLPEPGAAKVIEYGDARARYVLVQEPEEEPASSDQAETPAPARRGAEPSAEADGSTARRRESVRGLKGTAVQRAHRRRVLGSA